MEDESKNIYINNIKSCKACVEGVDYKKEDLFSNITVREMITKDGMLIPTPGVKFANLNPALTRHQDSLTSTDRRINQGADQIIEAQKERISETKDSQLRCLNLIPELKEKEQIRDHPKKPKAYLSKYTDKTGSCPFYNGKSFITTPSDSYRSVMQAANLVNYEKRPRSITRSDFRPKVLYPFSEPSTEEYRFQSNTNEWMKNRKKVSLFCDHDVPKKYGYYKFTDDAKPTLFVAFTILESMVQAEV